MTSLLQIHSSLNGADSLSSALAGDFVARWRELEPHGRVVERDLAREPVPHLTADVFAAFAENPALRDAPARLAVARSDALIDELRTADVIVLGLPMYNFGVPSTLKAWIDHVARAGETFRYTEQGPVGLLPGKKVFVFATRGGAYAGTPTDTQSAYIANLFAFLGIDAVEFVYAERLAMGDDDKSAALKSARQRIDDLTLQFAA